MPVQGSDTGDFWKVRTGNENWYVPKHLFGAKYHSRIPVPVWYIWLYNVGVELRKEH